MILTPIALDALDAVLAAFDSALSPAPAARAAWNRIRDSRAAIGGDVALWQRRAVALTDTFGMRPLDEAPERAFSWDGSRVRARTEASVLLHEVAHYQLASPARRRLPDFGLGAGPETGRVEIADRARCLGDAEREAEEQMASLLGILWEVELGQPGILAFQEQNWLEGAGRPSTAQFFESVLERLVAGGFVDREARPLMSLSVRPDRADATGRRAA
jgi:hypothetical protein